MNSGELARVAHGQEVFIVDQVVHLPARCWQEEAGNTIQCGA